MKTYLVTGGAGFIGSNFVIYMLSKYNDVRIVNVDALTYAGNLENLVSVENHPNYRFVQANICDAEAISKIFEEENIDYVVNFAAESHVDRSISDPEIFVKTNVLGTVNLLNLAKKAWQTENDTYRNGCKFLQVSTDEVYGLSVQTGSLWKQHRLILIALIHQARRLQICLSRHMRTLINFRLISPDALITTVRINSRKS